MEEEQKRIKRRRRNVLMEGKRAETASFCINDHNDVVVEVLKRLDGRSLGVAACVCHSWSLIAKNEEVWEYLCFRQSIPPAPSPSVRSLVVTLGGYKRLYMMCVRPALSSLRRDARRVWKRHGAQLSLSLFCVDYYQRHSVATDSSTDSLMFLCNPLDV